MAEDQTTDQQEAVADRFHDFGHRRGREAGQRDMQHRAALAVIQSGKDKGLTEERRELLAEAAEAVLGLEVRT